jgi:hypothetical protein
MWTFALALLAGGAQLFTAYLGYAVTVEPITANEKKRKFWFKFMFVVAGVLGLFATAIATYDGQQTIENLRWAYRPDIKGQARYKTTVLEAGHPIQVHVTMVNAGAVEGKAIKVYCAIGISPQHADGQTDTALVQRLERNIASAVASNSPTWASPKDIEPGKRLEFDVEGPAPTSPEQVLDLQAGRSSIYLLHVMYYKGFQFFQNNTQGHFVSTNCAYDGATFGDVHGCGGALANVGYFGQDQYVLRP